METAPVSRNVDQNEGEEQQRITVATGEVLPLNALATPFDGKYALFKLKTVLPAAWEDLLDESGQIVWRFEQTLAVRAIGNRRATSWIKFLTGSEIKLRLWFSIPVICSIVSTLGIFKIVPEAIFIVTACTYSLWQLWSFAFCADLRIASRVGMNFANLGLLVTVAFGQVCFGMMVDWDYRGIGWFVVMVTLAMSGIITESAPKLIRVKASVLYLVAILRIALLLVLLNLLLIPDLNITRPFIVVTFNNGVLTNISALGLFNQSTIAVILLMWRNAYAFHCYPLRLPNMTLTLNAVDDPNANPVATFANY